MRGAKKVIIKLRVCLNKTCWQVAGISMYASLTWHYIKLYSVFMAEHYVIARGSLGPRVDGTEVSDREPGGWLRVAPALSDKGRQLRVDYPGGFSNIDLQAVTKLWLDRDNIVGREVPVGFWGLVIIDEVLQPAEGSLYMSGRCPVLGRLAVYGVE